MVTRLLLLVLAAFCFTACQTVTEPEDVVVDGGFPLRVDVVNQNGGRIDGATVTWRLVTLPAAINDSTFFDDNGIPGGRGTTSNGSASFIVPMPVADPDILFVTKVDPPSTDQRYGQWQKNGAFRIDTAVVCDTTILRYELIYREYTACNSAPECPVLDIAVDPPTTPSRSATMGPFVQSDQPIVVSDVFLVPQPDPAKIRTTLFVNGVPATLPASIPIGTPYEIRFDVTYTEADGVVDELFVATLVVDRAGGGTCWQCTSLVSVKSRPQTPCDCPPDTTFVLGAPNRIGVCTGQTKDTTIALNLTNTNTECALIYRLRTSALPVSTDDVDLLRMNGSRRTQITIPPGETLDSITVRMSPTTNGIFDQRFVFDVIKQTQTGQEPCPDPLVVEVRVDAGLPTCRIDFAASSLFRQNGNVWETVPLENCVGLTTVSPLRQKTIVIRNDGQCPVTINLTSPDPQFVYTPTEATIPPNGSVTVRIHFQPDPSRVYPTSRCGPRVSTFPSTLSFAGCLVETHPIRGVVLDPDECAIATTPTLYQHGATDNAGRRWITVLDILRDRIELKENATLDTAAIYVRSIATTGAPNVGSVNAARLESFQDASGCWVLFHKIPVNLLSLSKPICEIFGDFICPVLPTGDCSVDVVAGDVVIFERNGLYGIIWIKNLSWSNRSATALPQVEMELCYPLF